MHFGSSFSHIEPSRFVPTYPTSFMDTFALSNSNASDFTSLQNGMSAHTDTKKINNYQLGSDMQSVSNGKNYKRIDNYVSPKDNDIRLTTTTTTSPTTTAPDTAKTIMNHDETLNVVPPPSIELHSKEFLFEAAAKILFLAVKWSKSVPTFNQLSMKDQKKLLEDSWAELFVITAAQWGLPIDNGGF